MRNWLSVIVFLVCAIGFNQSVSAQSTEYVYKGNLKAFSVNGAAGNTYVWKLTHPDNSVETLPSTTSSSGDITFNATGDYVLWVQATDLSGCLSEPIQLTITSLPNDYRFIFNELTSTACIQANNDFLASLKFYDANTGQLMSADHFPVTVSYRVNGANQTPQVITNDDKFLKIYSSSFAVNPNSDNPVEVTITGATDSYNLNVLAETASDQHIHTHTIFRDLITPTVSTLITNDLTPEISGTASVGANELLTVTVNGTSYIPGDGNLNLSGTNWTLTLPNTAALAEGVYEVTAIVSNVNCFLGDASANELTIDTTSPDPPPTVSELTTSDTTPLLSGTATVVSGDMFTVTVNGKTYISGDGNLILTGTNWTLQIPSGDELPDGTYPVTATVTDAAGNSATDLTSDELHIDTVAPEVPTVFNLITNNQTPVLSGTATVHLGDVLKVTVNNITYVQGDGNLSFKGVSWSLQIPAGNEIPEGVFPVTVTLTDAAGNSSTDVTTDELTIDITGPAPAPTVNELIINDPTPLISGTATVAANELFTVIVNGITYTLGDGNLVLSGTNWTLQIPEANTLADGIFEVQATVTDEAGNSSSEFTSDELRIDTTTPEVPTVLELITNVQTPLISGTSTIQIGDVLRVTVNDITYTSGDGNLSYKGVSWSLQIPAGNELPEGVYPVTATVTDAAGNFATDATTNELTVDITKPAPIPTVNALVTNDSTPVLTGTATVASGDVFTVTINNIVYTAGDGNLVLTGNNWSLQIPASDVLADGIYEVIATVTDAAGNASTDTSNNELVIDTVAPTPAPTVTSQISNSNLPLITGSANVGQGEIFKVVVNGKTYQLGDGRLKSSGNVWSLQIAPGNELPDGIYSVTATVTDAAGNSTTDVSTSELIVNTKNVITDRFATNDVNITFKNIPVSGNVLINDAGFYNFKATVGVDYQPVNGTLILSPDGNYTYTPKTDFTGTDNFYYTVCTPEDPQDCDTVNVTVRIMKDVLSQVLPVAMDDEMQTPVNTLVRGNVLANDLSVNGEKLILNRTQKEGPFSGTLVLKEDGSFEYTPKTGFTGQDYFVYEVCSDISGNCASARVTITVSADLHEVQLFAADDVFFSYGKAIQGNLLDNDSYPSLSTLSISKLSTAQAKNGTVSINASGTFTYIPNVGFEGTDQFVYEICDSKIPDCDFATVYVAVKAPPALHADLIVEKTGPLTAIPGESVNYKLTVTNLGTDVASSIQISDYLPAAIENPKFNLAGSTTSASWAGYYELNKLDVNTSFSLFISGTVSVNAPDTIKNIATVTSLSWDPNQENNVSLVKTVLFRGPVARISGAPYLSVGACDEAGRVLDASKSAGNGLQYSWSPATYLDDANSSKPVFLPGQTTRYKLTVTDINGIKDTTSVLVIVPAAPVVVTDRNVFVDTPNKTIMLDGSKSTGSGLSFLWTSQEGTLLNGETTPTAQVSGLGIYYLQITDSLGCTARDSVNVGLYIQAMNDTTETNVDESVLINVVRNDIPVHSANPSSISIVTPPLHGIAEIAADSLILYMPEQTYIGQDEFVYAICDYFKNCDQAKVLVLINDVPFFVPEAFSPNSDGINDEFEIKGILKYKTVQIEIFNRWGNVVYRSSNYGPGPGKDGFWNGKASTGLRVGSGPVPTGTYFYILKLNGKETINGSIYIDR
ncbi:MAG: Ig-like domain-containing protein [Prolixibacteraceae bacterium]